ncbi:MAG TPA: 2-phospho-L-lactate transferase [Nitrososphaeraceae archaeon]|nr:2-phospho-L-lactate transferase [Nitrososphaeraceae archaeon]
MITLIAGGTGSVKLARGLSKTTDNLVIVSNIADNIWLHGLYICPDIDTVVYGLSGQLDKSRGWGVMDDTFVFLEQMKRLGQDYWFKIGDKDLALHILRTRFLNEGKSLSWFTEWIRKKFSISTVILPTSDCHYETRIETSIGEMHIQEYWVKNHAELDISNIRYVGIEKAVPNPKILDAIRNSDMIIIAPGNPISSIDPITLIPSVRKKLESRKQKVIAVSPLIGHQALSGPASKYLDAMGIESSPAGIASHYSEIASNLIISESDKAYENRIRSYGVGVHKTNIIMENEQDEIRLSKYILKIFNHV